MLNQVKTIQRFLLDSEYGDRSLSYKPSNHTYLYVLIRTLAVDSSDIGFQNSIFALDEITKKIMSKPDEVSLEELKKIAEGMPSESVYVDRIRSSGLARDLKEVALKVMPAYRELIKREIGISSEAAASHSGSGSSVPSPSSFRGREAARQDKPKDPFSMVK